MAATSRLTSTLSAALEADLLADDDTETTLVVGWQHVSSGWATEGERVLALAAAARASEYAQWKAQLPKRPTNPKLRKDE